MFKEIKKPEAPPEEITTLRLRIQGAVQGVGFRAFVVREATERRLSGWVRNRLDGTVEAVASGPTKQIEALVSSCTRGPAGARVQHIDMTVTAAPSGPGFTLRATM
jgi:acylphosphatase